MKKGMVFGSGLVISFCMLSCTEFSIGKKNNADQSIVAAAEKTLEGKWTLKYIQNGDAIMAHCGDLGDDTFKEATIIFTNEKIGSNEYLGFSGESTVNSFRGRYKLNSFDKTKNMGKLTLENPIVSTKIGGDATSLTCEKNQFEILTKSTEFTLESGKEKERLVIGYRIPLPANSMGEISYNIFLYFEKK